MKTSRHAQLMGSIHAVVAAMAFGTTAAAAAQALESGAGDDGDRQHGPKQGVASLEAVNVVGSQIKRAAANGLLPVASVDAAAIEATGAVSGGDLFGFIPQMGDVSFANGGSTGGANSSNHARGDVSGIDLRGLGVGSTLLLINGRRTVTHPMSQSDDQLVPVFAYNANTLPVNQLRKLDILLDGAAATYGSDAVAGVVNAVLKDDLDGGEVTARYGVGEGTGLRDFSLDGLVGRNFDDYRGNVTLSFSHSRSSGLDSWDQDWTRTFDRRSDFAGTRFEGAAALDQRPVYSRWGNFTAATGAAIRQDGVAITNAAGVFHVMPDSYGTCTAAVGEGLCLGAGNKLTGGSERDLRADPPNDYPVTLNPTEYQRNNLFLTGKYDFDNGVSAFGEAGYYRSGSHAVRQAVYSLSSKVWVPASNYWNPFGQAVFDDGTVNPNRLPGLDLSDDGAAVRIDSYRIDRPTYVKVESEQARVLAGVKGFHYGYDWESALLYTYAWAQDCFNAVSMTRLQESLARSTPDAFNPFGGINSEQTLDAITVDSCRRAKNTLYSWDIKASRPDLFSTWAGDVGFAVGTEVRHETHDDDRDARVDGTLSFTDSVTGATDPVDLYGDSPTPDSSGSRTVSSVFAEFQVPLVSAEMGVPLVRSLDLQLAGRMEHYSDFGTVIKPKVALGWELVDGLRLRASYSEGFRAPNLEQMAAVVLERANTRTDYIQCEAELETGAISSFSNCSHSGSTTGRRAGNRDLQPEESKNHSAGVVFQPRFLPESWGRMSFSLDYFKYDQTGLIGVFGEGNGLILDYVMRMQGGSNPNVVRADPTAEDVARFAGTGLEPAGEVLYVNDRYVNLQPQTVRGVDLAFSWTSPQTRLGTFRLDLDGTHLIEFYREPSPDIQVLLDARAAGVINPATIISGGGDLLAINGNPEWKWSGSLLWNLRNLSAGASVRYVGNLYNDSVADDSGGYWEVDSHSVTNLFARYDFGADGWLSGTSVKLGVNNLADKRPPVAATLSGYVNGVYSAVPRYFYAAVTKKF